MVVEGGLVPRPKADKTGREAGRPAQVKVPQLNRSNTHKKTERLSSALKMVVEGGLEPPRPKARVP